MKLDLEVLKSLFNNSQLDSRGENLYADCPYCGHREFGISLKDNHRWGCFRGNKCGERGNIFKLLEKLGRKDLFKHRDKDVPVFQKLKNQFILSEEISLEMPDIYPPLGFYRVYEDEYLKSRGFTEEDFYTYNVGYTNDLLSLHGYIIILIEQGGSIKGYVARSKRSREWIDKYNEKAKALDKTPHLRYRNSTGTDFAGLLLGLDEVTNETKRIILVEGPFDKFNVGKLLSLHKQEKIKCLCTFGKKISSYQIGLLKKKNIESVILLYDPDAINDSKKYSFELEKYFNVQVAYLKDTDPGGANKLQLSDALSNTESPLNFKLNKLQYKLKE